MGIWKRSDCGYCQAKAASDARGGDMPPCPQDHTEELDSSTKRFKMIRYTVFKEVRWDNGKKETWFMVEPKNPVLRWLLLNIPPFSMEFYRPHSKESDAIEECKALNDKRFDGVISRKEVDVSTKEAKK